MEKSIKMSVKEYEELIKEIEAFKDNKIKETIVYKSSYYGLHSVIYEYYNKEDINSKLLNEIRTLVKKIHTLENKTFTQKLKDLFI